jgi:hypothetical protein
MATFKLNAPVVQKNPTVTVDVAATAPFPLGAQRFQLVVVDDSGNESVPTFLDVVIKDLDKPTAVLDLVNVDGTRIDPVVDFGKSFTLSAARSTDLPPGKVVEYRFTLVDRGT